ncbi:Paqr-1p [Globodera pallida]|nr:Paqr-1p [Globodera pallida]
MPARVAGSDFVSADVNEVLEDARQILTNSQQRKDDHPNDRVLDESTRVKVTKTGGDEDPLEVHVWRSRLVRREETDEKEAEHTERGYASDTDVATASTQRNRAPSIHQCAHRKTTSIGSLGATLGEADAGQTTGRHMEVVYRRQQQDSMWQRKDEEHPVVEAEGRPSEARAEDNAQLKVEITEQCRTEDGEHLVEQTWEIQWTVQNFHALPDWLQDNEFLHDGHRPPLPSFAVCFKSILSLHTETGNIWTHLIGCLVFFFMALWFLTRPNAHIQFQEKLVFSSFFLGAILCLGLSFTFHTVSCHSKPVVRIFSRLDYMGISLLIVGSFIPWIYYGFYCRREPKVTYIAMIGVLGLGAVIVSLWDKFNDKRYRPFRAGIFSLMGLSGIIPTLHFVYTDGLRRLIDENSFYWLITMALIYLFGALLYATRTPERFFPGKCDLLFQSHQLFHVCVVCAALTHYYGISEMAMNRLTGTCPMISNTASSHLHNEL